MRTLTMTAPLRKIEASIDQAPLLIRAIQGSSPIAAVDRPAESDATEAERRPTRAGQNTGRGRLLWRTHDTPPVWVR